MARSFGLRPLRHFDLTLAGTVLASVAMDADIAKI